MEGAPGRTTWLIEDQADRELGHQPRRIATDEGMPENDVAVVGCGYVGLVTAIGLAEQGNRVRAYDIDAARIAACRRLSFPMIEPGLEEAAKASGDRLSFHDVREESWPNADFTFLALPTPQGDAGYPNLSMLRQALKWIADGRQRATAKNVIVIRSTVPPGTAKWAHGEIGRLMGTEVPVVANPEFLQEGRAMADFRSPSRILIGSEDHAAAARLQDLMAFTGAPVIITDTSTAELAKYGSNAFLAMRISFANEIARLAEREGADPLVTLEAVGMDPRIGPRYLRPGVGYGGSCLPKDVAALVSMGNAANEPMALMRAIQEVNESQVRRILRTLAESLDGLSGRQIAVLGLAFKPGTNDIRDSPGLRVARDLRSAGATVVAWDASVTSDLLSPADRDLTVVGDPYEALNGAEAAVLCTEWPEVVDLDFLRASQVMARPLLVDGRYAWDPARVSAAGMELVRIGSARPVLPSTRAETLAASGSRHAE
jgi:UDPglucose 6-dehydrogenase